METSSQTPSEIRQRIWIELSRATQDRHHDWRTPVLASITSQGLPDARTVVLREADANTTQLRFYADGRSPKVAQLDSRPDATLVFWSKPLNWQLRVRVSVTPHLSGPLVDSVWARVSQSAAAGDYLTLSAPGTPLSAPAPAAVPQGHHLVVLNAEVLDIDWLELGRGGHRRAKLGADTWDWLTP
jgi:pyridoxamine 5'-phosphate oxidase